QPLTLITGLVAATKSTDTTRPSTTITSPTSGQAFANGTAVTITGTATDSGGGVVAGVEVSTDGGATWHPATGTTSWSYSWIAAGSPTTQIRARAVDDSGNIESSTATTRTVTVGCPCSLWRGSTTLPASTSPDNSAVEVGVRFVSDTSGFIR